MGLGFDFLFGAAMDGGLIGLDVYVGVGCMKRFFKLVYRVVVLCK